MIQDKQSPNQLKGLHKLTIFFSNGFQPETPQFFLKIKLLKDQDLVVCVWPVQDLVVDQEPSLDCVRDVVEDLEPAVCLHAPYLIVLEVDWGLG